MRERFVFFPNVYLLRATAAVFVSRRTNLYRDHAKFHFVYIGLKVSQPNIYELFFAGIAFST